MEAIDSWTFFDEAFRHASECSLLIDEDFVIVRVSDGFLAASGFVPADILGSRLSDFAVAPSCAPALSRLLVGLKAGEGPRAVDLAFRSRRGGTFPSTVFLVRLPGGPNRGPPFLGFARPFRRNDEEARILIDSPCLHRIIEGIVEPILMVGVKTRSILDCNRSFSIFMGWTRSEVLGQTTSKLFESERCFAEFRSAARARSGVANVDLGAWRLMRRDGSLVPCSVIMLNIFRLFDEGPAAMYLLFDRTKMATTTRALAKLAKDNMLLAREFLAVACDSAKEREHEPRTAALSRRQAEIVSLVAQGLSSKEIAARLDLSETTIRNHLSILFRKFDVSSRMALMNVLRARGALPG